MVESHTLTYWHCAAILRAGDVGRIAFSTPDGAYLVPLNYSVVNEAIILRTAPDTLVARYGADTVVAFEVDYIDQIHHRGCSVVARGNMSAVTDPAEAAQVARVWKPQSWAAGDRSLLLKLPWTELTGRQLGHGWDPLAEVPARRSF